MAAHRGGRDRAGSSPRRRAAEARLAAPGSYKLAELARAAGVTPRAIRLYVTREILPAPVFRGRSTTYGEEHLTVLRAVALLRATEGLRLEEIRRRLAKLSPAEVAALAAAPPPAQPPSAPAPASDDALTGGAERWDRLVLLPGLELHLRGDATAVVRRLAAEIRGRYGGLPPERDPA